MFFKLGQRFTVKYAAKINVYTDKSCTSLKLEEKYSCLHFRLKFLTQSSFVTFCIQNSAILFLL